MALMAEQGQVIHDHGFRAKLSNARQAGQRAMSLKSAAAISMLLGLAWTGAHGDDDYPTDMDLEVAYCDGATEAALQSPEIKSAAAFHDLLAERKQHFGAYLASRGYGGRKDIFSLAPAMGQGKADLQLSEAASERCVMECQKDPLPADPKLKSKAIEDALGCGRACMIRSTDGRSEKLRRCEDIEKSLPF